MPCYEPRARNDFSEMQKRLNLATRLLCAVLRRHPEAKAIDGVAEWAREHDEIDRQRLAEQHNDRHSEDGYVVYNPHNKPIEELTSIFGFVNGGGEDWFNCVAITDDGRCAWGLVCSDPAYLPLDLNLIEGTDQEEHIKHCPDGYRCEYVRSEDRDSHAAFQRALKLANAQRPEGS